ncbi:MAG: WD40 repeat domain-containing protein [Treponema sp.]|jgi:hypothetical protein|nr:WD40 repeat domain-containing protein [Treponema sp.]
MNKKKKIGLTAGLLFFIIYFAGAARPIPHEPILVPRWLSSLETGNPAAIGMPAEAEAALLDDLLPFSLGSRFGYVDSNGRFAINQIKKGEVSLSQTQWTEFDAKPERITIQNTANETIAGIENPGGYPFFLGGRIFIIGNEQNALSEIDHSGAMLWTYDFAAPLTCVDAAAGLTLTGSLDGVVELLDSQGNRMFFFEPGGSRHSVILGCAISQDGSRIGIISGIDDQRFLLLERFGTGEYKVIYHEFLEDGFRRPVHIEFIEEDRWLVFEREGGVGLYEIRSRRERKVDFAGEIIAMDHSGGQGLFFVIVSRALGRKELVGVRLPGNVIMKAPFKSNDVFLGRRGTRLFVGGGVTLASFELEKR